MGVFIFPSLWTSKEENIGYVILNYCSIEEQDKFIDYIFNKTGKLLKLGPIRYNGKLTILYMKKDLSEIGQTNITCAILCSCPHFTSVDEFIRWYEDYSSKKEEA